MSDNQEYYETLGFGYFSSPSDLIDKLREDNARLRAELAAAQSDLSAEKSASRAAMSVLNDVRAELGLEDGYSVIEKVIELRMERDTTRQQAAEAGAEAMWRVWWNKAHKDTIPDVDPAAVARAALKAPANIDASDTQEPKRRGQALDGERET